MADFNNVSSVSSNGSGSVHNLSVGSDTAPHPLNERVNDIDERLTYVEQLLQGHSGQSFGSNLFGPHGQMVVGELNNPTPNSTQHTSGESGSTFVGLGGRKGRKTKKQKRQKKRGNKGNKLTKRNRK